MSFSYDDILRCVQRLGIDGTFTQEALDVLMLYSHADEVIIFGLISLLKDPFTDQAKKFLEIKDEYP